MMIRTFFCFAAVAAVTTSTIAQSPATRTVQIQFAKGMSSKAITGSVKGYDTVDYVVGARAGQTMTVALKTNRTSNYFNIMAPGADTAMYMGDDGTNRFSGALPSSGNYKIRVYLYRNDARRGVTAKYTLTVGIK